MNIQKYIIDKEEQALEHDLESGVYQSSKNVKETKRMFERATDVFKHLQASGRISIRVNNADLAKVKAKARKRGLPYQTLLNMLIHQYADDKRQVGL